jgi:hypothetical protein
LVRILLKLVQLCPEMGVRDQRLCEREGEAVDPRGDQIGLAHHDPVPAIDFLAHVVAEPLRSAERIVSSAKTYAARTQCLNCCWLQPRPYSVVSRRAAEEIFAPARFGLLSSAAGRSSPPAALQDSQASATAAGPAGAARFQ